MADQEASAMLAPGLTGRATKTVAQDMSAISLGSGDVPVLGTPAVLALVEQAACAAVARALGPGATTVGIWAEIEHLAPSAIGASVTASAELTKVDGRRLEFSAEAREGNAVVALATHRRLVVDRERFLAGIPAQP